MFILKRKSNLFLTLSQQQQSQTIVSSSAPTSIVVNSVTHTAAPIQATQASVVAPPVASVQPVPVPTNATPANQVRIFALFGNFYSMYRRPIR